MPINAGPEYFVADKKFLEARTREEKIAALEEMIRTIPKHKSSEKQLALLRKWLANLKKQKSVRATARPKFIIKKTGSAQVCIIGMTKSGKSSLLNVLTGVNVEVGDYPYTTKEPNVAMMNFDDVQVQLVEIPATFDPEFMSILYICDEILVLLDGSEDIEKQEQQIKEILDGMNLLNKKMLFVVNKSDLRELESKYLQISVKNKTGLEELKERIWSGLGLIRVYTKSPGKPKVIPPITLPIDSTVRNVAENIHKDFLKDFKFARIFNNTKFSGSPVGLDYKLNDLDVVEIHT